INELLETDKFGGRKWPGEVLRLAMLMTHYREPIDFSIARLEEAEALLAGWTRRIGGVLPRAFWGTVPAPIGERLRDDLDTPGAIQALHSLAATDADQLAAAMAFIGILPASFQRLANTPQKEA